MRLPPAQTSSPVVHAGMRSVPVTRSADTAANPCSHWLTRGRLSRMAHLTPEQHSRVERLVKALRGDRRQCRGWLSRGDDDGRTYDAGGLMCELAVEDGVIPPADPAREPGGVTVWLYGSPGELRHTNVLPPAVAGHFGFNIDARGPNLYINHHAASIAAHNDGGVNFVSLADAIERQLLHAQRDGPG